MLSDQQGTDKGKIFVIQIRIPGEVSDAYIKEATERARAAVLGKAVDAIPTSPTDMKIPILDIDVEVVIEVKVKL